MKQSNETAASGAKSNFGAWGWFIIAFTFLTLMFAGNLIIDSLNITLQAFNALRGWDAGVLLSFSTVAGIISIAGAAFLGRWVDKYGTRLVFVVTLLIVALCAFLWGHVYEIWQYVVILILVNVFGNGFGFIASTALIANWFPRKKGLAMGWATIGFQASAVVLLPLFTMALNRWGLSMAYSFVGVCLVIMAVICILFVRDNPEDRNCAPDNDKSMSVEEYRRIHEKSEEYISPFTTRRLLRTKQMWQVGLGMGLMQMAVSGLISQFVPKMIEVGMTQGTALTIYSAASVVGGVFSYIWGVLDQRMGTKKTSALAAFSHCLAAFACAAAGTIIHGSWWVYLSAVLVAINLGVSSNLLGSFTVTIFGRYDFARAFTPIYMITCGVRSLSFFTVGFLYSSTGNYAMSYIATGLAAILSMICILTTSDRYIGLPESSQTP